MDVVVISDVFGTRAGAYIATLLLCRALDDLGCKVTCFTTWVEPGFPTSDEEFTVVTPMVTRGYRWDWPNRSLAAQTIRHIKAKNPAMVIVMGVSHLSRYFLQSSIADRLLIWELTNGCGNKFIDVQASRLLSRCRAMLSPSMTIDQNIRAHYDYAGVIKRLPFWIEDHNIPYIHRPDEFYADFIYFGRRDKEKGLRELIQATAILANEYPAIKLVIGGIGEEAPFASMARDFNIEKNIKFGSFLSRHEVSEAMAKSRYLVLPSYHEGYPLVLLEAARSSLPFVATDVGSIREIFGGSKACLLVEARNVGSLERGMRKMLCESNDEYDGRRKAAYELFRQLSVPDRIAENLNSLLRFSCSQNA